MFFNKNVNQKTILNFVESFKEIGELQQFAIMHNDELQVKFAVQPYETTDVKQLYSISKTFTSLAVGKAIEEGRLDIHAKVLDFFRRMLPPNVNIDPKLEKMEVYHLLTMTTGHASCTMGQISGPNPILAFLTLPLSYEPGTHFAYNTGASLMLAVILNIVTGKGLDDYLAPLLKKMDINDYYFEKIMGNCLGGAGQHVNIDALISLGSLLLNKGMYKGEQLINKEYVELATSNLVNNSHNGTKDWTSGYGLHLWMSVDGYRADGAFGQLCMVMPSKNMVIAVQAHVNNMQKEMDLVRELVDNLYGETKVENIEHLINEVYKIDKTENLSYTTRSIKVSENEFGVNDIHIHSNKDSIKIVFGDKFEIEAGNGHYLKSKFLAVGVKVKHGMMPSFLEESILSSYYINEGDKLIIVSKNHNTPLKQEFVFEFDVNSDDCNVTINNKVLKGKYI